MASITSRQYIVVCGPVSLCVTGPSHDGKDGRRDRCASQSIIPSSTSNTKAVGQVTPELNGKPTDMTFRVPMPEASVANSTDRVGERLCSMGEIVAAIKTRRRV